MIKLFGAIFLFIERLSDYCKRRYQMNKMASIGDNVYIGAGGVFDYKNISIGNDVYIGRNAIFQSTYGKIIIGNSVMFGPGVNIHGGNHKIYEIGELLKHTSEKKMGDDGVVVIEDDCWISANAIILSNVVIGKGSVVGAGAIVTKSIPPLFSLYWNSNFEDTK